MLRNDVDHHNYRSTDGQNDGLHGSHRGSNGRACQSGYGQKDDSDLGVSGNSRVLLHDARRDHHGSWRRTPDVQRRNSRGADSVHRCRSASSLLPSIVDDKSRWH